MIFTFNVRMFKDDSRSTFSALAILFLFQVSYAVRVYYPDDPIGPNVTKNEDNVIGSRFGGWLSKKTKLGGLPFKHFDYRTSATYELKKNAFLSAPEDCTRECNGGPPKICYYHFTLELYTVLGRACQSCRPNATNSIKPHCQCVEADGVERGILTINRMLPGPSIQVCEGDKVVIDVENHLEGEEVSLHWHGILQKGTQYYDGAPFVTQCPIQQGNAFRYQWIANRGSHFYHSHSGLQKIDGLHGSIIVRQPANLDPNGNRYDFDLPTHVIFLSDWLHQDSSQRFPGLLRLNAGQLPNNILINGKGKFRNPATGSVTNITFTQFEVTAGKKYRFRLINSFATVCPAQLSIEGHDMLVIATDGEPVKPVTVNTIISFSGERYDFVINANRSGSYWIQVRGLGFCGNDRIQQLAILKYSDCPEQPESEPPTYDEGLPQGVVLNPLDAKCQQKRLDAICVSQLQNSYKLDPEILKKKADVKIFLPFKFFRYSPADLFKPNTYNRFLDAGNAVISLVDGISYMSPPAPLISQYDDNNPEQFCNGDEKPPECGANCMCTHKIDIPLNAIVEIVLVDEVQTPNLSHPFHLHGHTFNVIGIGRSPDKKVKKISLKHAIDLDKAGLLFRKFNVPPAKDTIAVPNNGYVVLRMRADNPGFWFFHCHFLFHIAVGMSLVLQVGERTDLPPIPVGFPTCGDHLPPISMEPYKI
ncbi:hypothetical protein WA026_006979 [Henosepilachna vigintioctopunctata]|uniref:Laccase n=1 Tax=Henosepilachna vigintioctopunctata TaxID=420089 RepID=A0AAW1VBI3_9CUCU